MIVEHVYDTPDPGNAHPLYPIWAAVWWWLSQIESVFGDTAGMRSRRAPARSVRMLRAWLTSCELLMSRLLLILALRRRGSPPAPRPVRSSQRKPAAARTRLPCFRILPAAPISRRTGVARSGRWRARTALDPGNPTLSLRPFAYRIEALARALADPQAAARWFGARLQRKRDLASRIGLVAATPADDRNTAELDLSQRFLQAQMQAWRDEAPPPH